MNAAVGVLRVQLRSSHVLGLTPHEAGRALHFSEQGGWVHALGALHRGEDCGFTLMLRRGRHIEWHVRPLLYLSLDAPPPPGRPHDPMQDHRPYDRAHSPAHDATAPAPPP